jgi:tyrosinase
MTASRRDVLLQGAVIGAGVIASNMPGIEALAQAQPPERRSLEGLAWNDPIVATYRDAVGIMKQKPDAEQFSWVNLSKIHGTDPNTYNFCPHGNWYFLPWHRAFTAMYERIVRNLTGNNGFAMPYWDWTNNPTMPEVFLTPTTPDGKTNWLYVNDQAYGQTWTRTWPPTEPMPIDQVGPAVLQSILDSTPYENFGTSMPGTGSQGSGPVQDSLDQSWINDEDSGTQGILEGNPHNNVHNNIGGWMPSASSPRDPIFFMHHANIDRIWAVWNSLGNPNSPEHFWKDMQIINNFYNVDGSYWSPLVSDLYSPEALGYTYGLPPGPAVAAAAPMHMALQTKLRTLFAAPKVADAAGVRTFAAANTGQASATPAQHLAVSVDVDPGLVSAVARRRPVSSGTQLLNFASAREARASGTRALGFIRDVAVTQPRDTSYRVFIEHPNPSSQTPVNDPHYVGTFAILGHGSHHGRQRKPSFALDLTHAIQRVYGSAAVPPSRIQVQIVAVPKRPNTPQSGTATVGRVEVAFVSS